MERMTSGNACCGINPDQKARSSQEEVSHDVLLQEEIGSFHPANLQTTHEGSVIRFIQ